MLKLISNYRSAYLQLADTQVRMDSVAAGRRTLEQLNEKIPLAWRASRSAAMIARGAGDEMADLRDLYIRQMTDVMERKLATVDIYDIYVHQEVELTWQLLRFIGEHERALDLMIAAEKHLRNPTMLSRLNAVDRVVLLFHAANVAGDDLADFDQASILLEQCQAATRRIPRAAQAEQQFRNELRLSRTAFEGEVQRRIIELQRKQSEADTFHMSE